MTELDSLKLQMRSTLQKSDSFGPISLFDCPGLPNSRVDDFRTISIYSEEFVSFDNESDMIPNIPVLHQIPIAEGFDLCSFSDDFIDEFSEDKSFTRPNNPQISSFDSISEGEISENIYLLVH